ncbi:MAG: hypothetical protein WCR95_02610 [Eubacteriales bacterium]
MNVGELSHICGFENVSLERPEKQIKTAYAGDLLSWVMARAGEGSAWLTIMTNTNVLAVAELNDISCVIICEGAELQKGFAETAALRKINVLRSESPVYETALKLGNLLNQK